MPKLNIRLRATSTETRPQQIATQISDAIRSGRLRAGEMLPSERALGTQLGVNRKTVRAAYELLAEWRLVETLSTLGRQVRGRGVGSRKGGGKKGGSKKRGSKKGGGKKGGSSRKR